MSGVQDVRLSYELRQQIRDRRSRERMRLLQLESAGEKRCSGCQGEIDMFTRGCATCTERRLGRKKRGHVANQCVGCGHAYEAQTPGCRPCTYRHSKRRERPATATPS